MRRSTFTFSFNTLKLRAVVDWWLNLVKTWDSECCRSRIYSVCSSIRLYSSSFFCIFFSTYLIAYSLLKEMQLTVIVSFAETWKRQEPKMIIQVIKQGIYKRTSPFQSYQFTGSKLDISSLDPTSHGCESWSYVRNLVVWIGYDVELRPESLTICKRCSSKHHLV